MEEFNLEKVLEVERKGLVDFVRGIVRDSSLAQDLTQEALVKAHSAQAGLRDPLRVVPWLYRIAANVCRDHFRRVNKPSLPSRAQGIEPDDLRDENAPQLSKVMECAEMSECVNRYFSQLPDQYRAVILFHDVEGMTNPEIAELLDISLEAAKIRLHRARKRLREILEGKCSFHTDDRGVLVCEPLRS